MAFKHVWKFQAPDGSTWKEVWYNDRGGAVGDQVPENQDVVQNRLLLLNPQNKFVSSTISDIANPRAVASQIINLNGIPFKGQNATPDAAPDGASNVCILVGKAGGQRHWWLRGGDADDYRKNGVTGVDIIGDGLKLALPQFFKSLEAVSFGLKLTPKVRPNDPTRGYFYMQSAVAGAVAGQTDFTLNAAPDGWTEGQQITIGLANQKDTPGLKGLFTIIKIVGTRLTLQYQLPRDLALTSMSGRVRYVAGPTISIFNAQGCKWVYNGTHRQRAPGPNSRGSKRAVRLRPLD